MVLLPEEWFSQGDPSASQTKVLQKINLYTCSSHPLGQILALQAQLQQYIFYRPITASQIWILPPFYYMLQTGSSTSCPLFTVSLSSLLYVHLVLNPTFPTSLLLQCSGSEVTDTPQGEERNGMTFWQLPKQSQHYCYHHNLCSDTSTALL